MKNIYLNIYKPNKTNLKKAKDNIKNDNVIGMPTETVYGLAGNAYSKKSIKKITSELYISTINQILLLRTLSNKVQRLLKIKEQEDKLNNLDNLINTSKPAIFWKEKLLVKKQLSIWNIFDLKKIINDINNTELLCKKNPQISNSIFFNFFSAICKKANNFS